MATFIVRFILFAVVHSLCVGAWIKRLSSGPNGVEPFYYRVLYNVASLFMFAWVMAAYHHSPVIYYIPGIWSLVMYLLQFVIVCVLIVCMKKTGFATFLGLRQLQKKTSQDQLVTTGCYAMVRHPIYLFSLLFLILNPVMSAQWLLLTLLSFCYFVVGALIEEKRLLKRFGTEYRQYQQNVPFLFPALHRIKPTPAART
ncbi:MAG: hypothetical protein A2X80_02430 [Geobacteraceae bacterium GWB2_52_12]|nr:MAG: hypothetical protein A2X80_02430 [Geobacteraceae bacterium GWB2_52_12]